MLRNHSLGEGIMQVNIGVHCTSKTKIWMHHGTVSEQVAPDHRIILKCLAVSQIFPYNHHSCALFCCKPSRNDIFT